MILETSQIKDYEVDGSEEIDGGEVSIETSNMALFYDMMSKSIYSNPHGSIIRELVSNAFDAHQEIDVKKPVIIKAYYEEQDLYLSIQDFGIGISKERFHSVYLKYLSSTKRDSNKYFGAFGLGSKSPFSYTDVFYVLTRFEGKEYYYAMSKGQNGTPNWDLLYEKDTTEDSGTTIKFIIDKGKYGTDYGKFQAEITNQLRYFDDVYVEGFDVENEYEIIDYPTFKFRKDTVDTKMHIALGKVTYPIDWVILKRPQVNVPVGVKFEIGELMITSNRESIRYNDEVIDIINDRINKCLKELESLAGVGTYDKLADLLAIKKEVTKYINLEGDIKLPVYRNLNMSPDGNYTYPFHIPKPQWTPFVGTPIEVPDNPFFIFRSVGFINSAGTYTSTKGDDSNKRRRELPHNYVNVYQMSQSKLIYRTNDFTINRMKIAYLGDVIAKHNNYNINRVCIIAQDNQLGVKSIAAKIGLFKRDKKVKVTKPDGKVVSSTTGEPFISNSGNKTKLIKLYRKEMLKEIISISKSYDNLEVPEAFVKSWKDKFKAVRLASTTDQIPVLNIATNLGNKVLVATKTLKEGLVVYGNNDDKNKLVAIQRLLQPRNTNRSIKAIQRDMKALKVIGLNLTDIKRMTESNQISVDKFVGNHKVFMEQITAYFIWTKYKTIDLSYIFEIMPSAKLWHDKVSGFVNRAIGDEYYKESVLESKFIKEFLKIAEEQNLLIKEYVDIVEGLTILQEDLELTESMVKGRDLTLKDKRDIAKFIVGKGYLVDSFYLYKPTQEEMDWAYSLVKYYGKNRYGYVTDVFDSSMEELLREAYNARKSNNYSLYTPVKSWHQNFPLLSGNKSVKISMLSLTQTEAQKL